MSLLLIDRQIGERVVIDAGGRRVTLVVVAAAAGQVRLGVDAPRDVTIWRAGHEPPDPTGPGPDGGEAGGV